MVLKIYLPLTSELEVMFKLKYVDVKDAFTLLFVSRMIDIALEIITLEDNSPNLDESILDLEDNKYLLKQTETTYCPVCGKLKQNRNLTCSKECASKRKNSFNWKQYDIIDMIENQKLTKTYIAELIGCSDVAVSKHYKKLKSS